MGEGDVDLRTHFMALLISLSLSIPYFATGKTWDGGGGDNNASTGENWSDDTIPAAVDDIVLGSASSKDMTWNGGTSRWEYDGCASGNAIDVTSNLGTGGSASTTAP